MRPFEEVFCDYREKFGRICGRIRIDGGGMIVLQVVAEIIEC